MSSYHSIARPIARSLRKDRPLRVSPNSVHRSFTQTATRHNEAATATVPPPEASRARPARRTTTSSIRPSKRPLSSRDTTATYWGEIRLMNKGTPPIGSRRRRAALRTSENIPFELMPYQCFQEARKILKQDRGEKLAAIAKELAKIKALEATPVHQIQGGEARRQMRLASLKKQVYEYTILADINDPVVKRRFEDGLGDMNKPIYRYLAERKWRGLPYRVIKQRLDSFKIVPDVLPKFEPVVDVQMWFRRAKVEPGEIIDSRVSEVPPRLKVQVFNAGARLVSVVVMDSDVPNAETDSFERRCHYLAANVPISPNNPSLPLSKVDKETQLAVRWLPAFAQKGAPYHRMSVFVLEQKPGVTLDMAKLRELYSGRDGFSLKSYRDKFGLTPVGFNIFRSVWDEGTAAVMERAGVPGADIEFKLKRIRSLKPHKKRRGWEAKRQKPKFKSVWKYSKRIRGMHGKRARRGGL